MASADEIARRRRRRGRVGRPRAGAARRPTRLNCASRSIGLLDRLPALDPRALHALGDEIAGTQAETLAAFMDAVNALAQRPSAKRPAGRRRGWRASPRSGPRSNRAAREAEAYNLDRKPLVFSVFGRLAEAARA